jgi:predicted secreted acid phosphatase
MPRKATFAILAAFVLLTLPTTVLSAQASTLPSKDQWLSDVRQAMSGSQTYVKNRAARGGSKLAVNFDIDNTTLASHYDPGQPVERVLRFAKYARSQGVELLFNTARTGDLSKARRALTRAGYVVTEMCGRQKGEAIAHSKQRCRQHFVDEGYTLVANVGNRSTDFVGGNYQRAYRLPNYNDQLT